MSVHELITTSPSTSDRPQEASNAFAPAPTEHRFTTNRDFITQINGMDTKVMTFEAGRSPSGERLETYHVGCAHYGLEWHLGTGGAPDADSSGRDAAVLNEPRR